jgi:hypothetical protein
LEYSNSLNKITYMHVSFKISIWICLFECLSKYVNLNVCLSIYLCLNVCLNICTLNISVCSTTCSYCLDFCSFSIVIINDFKQMGLRLEFSKWSWPCKYPNVLSFFGVVHLEFYCNVWILCLMCTIALFYSNPRLIKHDKASALRISGHGYMHQLI